MPREWVPPEEFVSHKGISIFHVYKDDEMQNGPREFWYTTSENDGEGSGFEFDVRNLPDYDSSDHEGTVKKAIEAGLLIQDEEPDQKFR